MNTSRFYEECQRRALICSARSRVGIALALFGTILVYMAARPVVGEGLDAMKWTLLAVCEDTSAGRACGRGSISDFGIKIAMLEMCRSIGFKIESDPQEPSCVVVTLPL